MGFFRRRPDPPAVDVLASWERACTDGTADAVLAAALAADAARPLDDLARAAAGLRDRPTADGRAVLAIVDFAHALARHGRGTEAIAALERAGVDDLAWGAALLRARLAIEDGDHAASWSALADLLIDVHARTSPAAPLLLPRTHGLLGEAYFHGGQAERAVAPTQRALELANAAGDGAQIITFLGNHYEISRYLARPAQASHDARLLADCFDRTGERQEAARWRAQAERVRRGEPLCRVVALVEGMPLELDEVPRLPADMVRFVIARNRPVLRGTVRWVELGRAAGRRGDLARSLDDLAAATALDPFDPQPHYERARTLSLLERFDEATTAYERVHELAPGWYHVRSHLWLARELGAGRLEASTLFILCVLEDDRKSPRARLELAARELARAPTLPQLHLLHGHLLSATGDDAGALAAYSRGIEHAREGDILSCLLWESSLLADTPGLRRIQLEQILLLDGANLLAAAQAKVTLRQMS